MKRAVAAVMATLGLYGCVSANMNDGLQKLVGHDIHEATQRLGYPDGQREMLGDTIYIWSSSHNVTLPMYNTSTTTGMVGNVPVYGTTGSMSYVPANFNCTIQLATDKWGTIKSYQWSGNMGGCSQYSSALNR